MAKQNLAEKLGSVEETFWSTQRYKNCEIRKSFNNEFYFFRLVDSRTFKNIAEARISLPESIERESKNEQEAVIKKSDYIASIEHTNPEIVRIYTKAEFY